MHYYLSIVIPIYNEQNRIEKTLNKIINYFLNKNLNIELILVNDGSNDNTKKILVAYKKRLQDSNKRFNLLILNNSKNMGKGFAVRRGVLSSKGKYVLFTDADLSTPIKEIEQFFKFLADGYNITIGSRGLLDSKIITRQNKIRQSMGKLYNLLVRKFINLNYMDTQCGFKCFDRSAVDLIFPYLKVNDFSFDIEILYLAGKLKLKVKELPVSWSNSAESRVRILEDSILMLINLVKLKRMHKNF